MKKSHNKQRNKRSFDPVIKAIQYLRKSYPDTYLQITTVVTSLNYSDLPQIYDLLLKLEVRDWKVCHLIPIGRAKARPDLAISADQTFQLLSWIASLNQRFRREKTKLKVSLACEGWCGEEFDGRIRDFFFSARLEFKPPPSLMMAKWVVVWRFPESFPYKGTF